MPALRSVAPSVAVSLFALTVLPGCLHLRLVDASVRKPSNVAVYFSVTDINKDPVPDLTVDKFHVYEDSKLVSVFESKQTILNPEVSAVHYTLLLMDMSGSVTGSGALPDLVAAADSFTERVGKLQQVAVYAFDGSKDIYPIVGFGAGGGAVRGGINGLKTFRARDPSTNLNGAVIEGIHVLEHQMDHATQPLRFGTLVVFTDGTDHAHRVPRADLMKALDEVEAKVNVFVIGLGAEIDSGELRAIARAGSILSHDAAQTKTAFDKVAQRVEGSTRSFYLFSYCSPARAGEHEVRIKIDDGLFRSGDLKYSFDAAGFVPNCDPNSPPNFDVHHPKSLTRHHR